MEDLAKKSGVPATTMAHWRKGVQPGVFNLSYVLDVMGLELVIRKKNDE